MQALVLARAGREAEALEAARSLFACGESLGDEPTLISQLVRLALHGIGCDLVRRLVAEGRWPAGVAKPWIERLEACQKHEPMRRAWIVERALVIDYVLVRQFDDEAMESAMPSTSRGHAFLSYLARRDLAGFVRMMTRLIALADRPHWEVRREIEALEGEAKSLPAWRIVTGMLLPAIGAVHETQANHLTLLELGRTAIALGAHRNRTGAWPEDLVELVGPWLERAPVDHLTGGPLAYRVEGGDAHLSIDRVDSMPEADRPVYEWLVPAR